MYKLIALLVLGVLHFHLFLCQKNQVILYDQPDQQGNSLKISMSSDLSWHNFDNKPASACVSGLILFYTDADFRGQIEWVFGGNCLCKNLTLAGKISSIRHPGYLEDVKKDSITLYNGAFYGKDLRVYGDTFVLHGFSFYSAVIITGGSNWTVFGEGGQPSACLIVPDQLNKTPSFLPRLQEIPNFYGDGIYSGRKGCNDTTINKVYLIPFTK